MVGRQNGQHFDHIGTVIPKDVRISTSLPSLNHCFAAAEPHREHTNQHIRNLDENQDQVYADWITFLADSSIRVSTPGSTYSWKYLQDTVCFRGLVQGICTRMSLSAV